MICGLIIGPTADEEEADEDEEEEEEDEEDNDGDWFVWTGSYSPKEEELAFCGMLGFLFENSGPSFCCILRQNGK